MNALDAKDCIRQAWLLCTNNAPWPFEPEQMLVEGRRWRSDFSNRALKLAIEINGVVYGGQGRHQRAESLSDEYTKLNSLAASGWIVLIFTPAMVNQDPHSCVEMIVKAADSRRWSEATLIQNIIDSNRDVTIYRIDDAAEPIHVEIENGPPIRGDSIASALRKAVE